MPKLKIRNPKGLYTNYDETDLSLEYLKVAENMRFRDGYMETLFYDIQAYLTGITFVDGESLVFYDTVSFNNDPLGVELVDDILRSNYTYLLTRAEIIITRRFVTGAPGTTHYFYTVYIREEGGEWFQPPNIVEGQADYELLKDTDLIEGEIKIFYINGRVKIFLPHESLWLGKIDRFNWATQTVYQGYYLTKLVEPYDIDNLGVIYYPDGTPKTAPGRRMGIIFTPSIETEGYEDERLLKLRYTGEEGYTFFIDELKMRRWRKYDILFIDDPSTIWSTLTIWSQGYPDETVPPPPRIEYTRFEDEPVGNVFWGNRWIFDELRRNEVQVTGIITWDELETWSAAGELSMLWNYDPSEIGFDPTYTDLEIVVTGLTDSRDEFVIAHEFLNVNETVNYMIRIQNIFIAYNSTKRLSAIAFYFKKHKDEADYEQVKFFNLIGREEVALSEGFYIDKLSPNGIYMNQTIGIVFDHLNHNLKDVVDDYKMANGIAYCLRENILHYPAIGNGVISENIFYKQYFIPNISESEIINLSNLKETLTIHTIAGMKLVIVQDLKVGELFFAVKDTIGYEISQEKAKQETPDGLFILTKQGIFFTDGQKDTLISQPINDIVEANYDTGGILYNPREKELWFYTQDTTQGPDIVYIYSFLYQKWSTIDLVAFGTIEIERLFLNSDFEVIIQSNGILHKVVEIQQGTARLITQETDLGDIKFWKAIDSVTAEFQGIIQYGLEDALLFANRNRRIFYTKLENRIPANRLWVQFNFINTSKFYAAEIDYEVISDGE